MTAVSIPRTVVILTQSRLAMDHGWANPRFLPVALVWGSHERFAATHPDQIRAALARIQPERLAWVTAPGEDAETLRLLQMYATLDVRQPPELFEVPERLSLRQRWRNFCIRLYVAVMRRLLRALAWCFGL